MLDLPHGRRNRARTAPHGDLRPGLAATRSSKACSRPSPASSTSPRSARGTCTRPRTVVRRSWRCTSATASRRWAVGRSWRSPGCRTRRTRSWTTSRASGSTPWRCRASRCRPRPTSTRTPSWPRSAMDRGFRIHGEVGKKFPGGDQIRTAPDVLDVDTAVAHVRGVPGHGMRRELSRGPRPPGGARRHGREGRPGATASSSSSSGSGLEDIIFEIPGTFLHYAGKRALQGLLVYLFGPDVNMANILIEEVAEAEELRDGTFPAFGVPNGDHPWIRSSALSGTGVPGRSGGAASRRGRPGHAGGTDCADPADAEDVPASAGRTARRRP